MEDGYKQKYENLLNDLLELSNNWKNTEKLTGEITWGECSTDLSDVIENYAQQM